MQYALTVENWLEQDVDQLLYEWWFDYRDDECDPEDLGSSTLKYLQPPDTSSNLV